MQNAKPGTALYPRLWINRVKQMSIWTGAVHEMWKYPMHKSILETSVLIIPMSFPVVNPPLVRAWFVKRREREKSALMRAPRRMRPVVNPR